MSSSIFNCKVMKSTLYHPLSILMVLSLLIASSLLSCKKTDNGAPPSITRVRTVNKVVNQQPVALDSTVTAGNLNGLYAIIGQNLATASSVTFNGVAATINPALNTNEAVIVTIAPNTPYSGQSNKLTITTNYGTATFDFTVLQPAPTITDVSQFAGNSGDIITITGSALDQATAVKFGTVAGQIQTNTTTQITVKVPANSFGPISVTTSGGTSTGPSVSYDGIAQAYLVPFGFSNILYDDAINAGYDFSFNGVTSDPQSTEVVKRGTSAIKVAYTGSYAGYAVGSGTPINLVGKTYVKFSIYGVTGTEGKVIKVALNDFDNRAVNVVLHEKKWSTYVIPINLFQNSVAPGTPTSLNYIGFQDLSGTPPTTIYLDDIGIY